MDSFGYSGAMTVGLHVYEQSNRQSGRTARLIEQIKDGDVIVVTTAQYAALLKTRLHEAGKKKVSVVVDGPPDLERLHSRLSGKYGGKVLLDHTWMLEYFEKSLERAEKDLQDFYIFWNKV